MSEEGPGGKSWQHLEARTGKWGEAATVCESDKEVGPVSGTEADGDRSSVSPAGLREAHQGWTGETTGSKNGRSVVTQPIPRTGGKRGVKTRLPGVSWRPALRTRVPAATPLPSLRGSWLLSPSEGCGQSPSLCLS